MTRVLVVGGGGREHALCRALARSERRPQLLAAPGNAGIARDGIPCLDVEAIDPSAIVAAAHAEHVDLVVIGPEAPLVAGLADSLATAGVRAFGPSAAAARIEGSKAYAKEVMAAAGVPTADHILTRTRAEADRALATIGYPAVLKADVLAAGKGVSVCATEADAAAALDELFGERRFGATSVLVERYLEGAELSLLAVCDGRRAVAMAPARDYKRIFDGDEGPNTGGMGSYSPVPEVSAQDAAAIVGTVHQPVVDELHDRGTPFHGVLYAGLMLTSDGPKVLEFNCRFGDPETQAILPRLRTDLLDVLEASVRYGGLADTRVEWSDRAAVTVVLASRGYPQSASSGDPIDGLEDAEDRDVEIVHAGTAVRAGRVVTAGGRVLNVTGLGATLDEARGRAYAAADRIRFPGMQLRRDIAAGARKEVRA